MMNSQRWAVLAVSACVFVAGCSNHHHHNPSTPTPTGGAATATATRTGGGTPTPTVTPGGTCAVGPVDTTSGTVCGKTVTTLDQTAHGFFGIPFGETTAPPNRWKAPIPKASMPGVFQATQFGPACEQSMALGESAGLTTSEDCLSINVWTPEDVTADSDLPVMVYIYGGAFIFGSSSAPVYNGAYLAAKGNVIVVSFNYRVGSLGFLAGIDELTGNYGFLDQQLALNWVHSNVKQFGGDPSKVTIFGESAGAMSVGLHLLSAPDSSSLFEAALMESNPFALPYKTVAEAAPFAITLAGLLGCAPDDLACLEAAPADEIVDKELDKSLALQGLAEGFKGLLLWAPVVDGTVITAQPVDTSSIPKPTLLGTNTDEGTVFIAVLLQELGVQTLSEAAYRVVVQGLFGASNVDAILAVYPPNDDDNADVAAQLATDYVFFCSSRFVAKVDPQSVYAYEFTKVSSFNYWSPPSDTDVPACDGKVCHADELPYVFNSATDIGHTFTADEEQLSQDMVAYWTNFSTPPHDPNSPASVPVNWPLIGTGLHYQILDTPISTQTDPAHHCDFWDTIGYNITSSVLTGSGS